jgi:hypothetical protein
MAAATSTVSPRGEPSSLQILLLAPLLIVAIPLYAYATLYVFLFPHGTIGWLLLTGGVGFLFGRWAAAMIGIGGAAILFAVVVAGDDFEPAVFLWVIAIAVAATGVALFGASLRERMRARAR